MRGSASRGPLGARLPDRPVPSPVPLNPSRHLSAPRARRTVTLISTALVLAVLGLRPDPASAQTCDLVISSGTPTVTPTSVAPGGTVQLSGWTVKNQGTGSCVGTFSNGFYLSTDSVITAADRLLTDNSNTTLAPGASFTWGGPKLTIPTGIVGGTYYIGILVDRTNVVAESNETNNYVRAAISVLFLLPDLVISSGTPTVTPTSVVPGGTVQLSGWTVKNQGTVTSFDFSNGFYLSTDSVITSSDIYLGGNSNNGLAPGASFTWGGPALTIPAGTAGGTYYIGILVDRTNAVRESNESNNYVRATVTVVVPLPDLVITSGTPTLTPASVAPGGTVQLSGWAVKNQGTVTSGAFSNGFYLSTDSVITSSDVYLTGNSNNGLAPGASFTWGGPALTIPAGTAGGMYYIGILVDRTNAVAESNEGNNYVRAVITVVGQPDLVISSGTPTVTPASVAAGGTVQLSAWTVRNQGTATAGSFSNGFYLSSDSVITSGDAYLTGNSNTALASGASYTWGGPTLTIPAGTAAGTYYIGILVDRTNAVAESNESNNYVRAVLTVVPGGGQPDLTIPSGTPGVTPASVAPGGSVQLSGWTVRNQGTKDSGPFSNGFYLSTNSVISQSDTYLTGNSNASLAPNASFTWGGPALTIPQGTPAGTYWIGILVDRTNAVAESNETNNYVAVPVTVVPSGPDLVISSGPPTVTPTSVAPGGTVQVSAWTVRNQGATAAGPFASGFFLSRDPAPGPTATFLAEALNPGLPAGASSTVGSQGVTVPSGTTAGIYYLGILVDRGNVVAESNESNNSVTVPISVTGGGCGGRPSPPRFTSAPTAAVPAGIPVTLAWTRTIAATDRLAFYRLELSSSADCSSPDGYVTTRTSLTVPTRTGKSVSYCAVVRAVSGDFCASDPSDKLRFDAVVPPAAFAVIRPQKPEDAVVDSVGGPVPRDAVVVFRNTGGQAASLRLTSGTIVSPDPRSFQDVEPGQDVTIRLVFDPLITLSAGFHQDYIQGEWTDGDESKTVSTAVTLTVLSTPRVPGATTGSRLQLSGSNELHFIRHDGNPPFSPVDVVNTGDKAVRVAPSIGPGGAWLSIGGDLSPIPPGGRRTLALSVDRSRRATADGDAPVTTNVTFASVDGDPSDAAILQVFDEEPDPTSDGRSRGPMGDGDSSLILGTAVSAGGAGGTLYLSDGWIRNSGSSGASVDLFYTPSGQDGLSGPDVKKATLSLEPYGTYRLADFVRGLFGALGTSGHVEIRSSSLPQLSVRTTVDSVTNKDGRLTRFGAEVPTVRSGQGTSAESGASLTIPGVRGGAGSRFRTNLLLAETSGDSADVILRLRSDAGETIGEKEVEVRAYSKVQVNFDDADLFPANVAFDGGSLEVQPVSGGGTVAAFATVIDNASQGYTTRVGRFTPASTAGPGLRALAAEDLTRFVIPTAAHIAGKNDSFYTTTVAITNGTAEAAQLLLTYRPTGAAPVGPKPLSVGARKSVTLDDVVGGFFGIQEGTAGMVVIEGAQPIDLLRIVAVSETSTPIDTKDSDKGLSPSTLAAYATTAAEVVGTAEGKAPSYVVSHPGLEETSRFRTNLILAEVQGEAAVVRVRLVPKGSGGISLGEETFSLGPFERLQINSFIRQLAKAESPDGQFVDVETIVEGVSGIGRVVAVATKIDNDPGSKRSDIYVLGPNGDRQGGLTIGF